MLEAVLGAIFLDAGFETAARAVEQLWGERLGSTRIPAPRPPKTQLQEWAQGTRPCRCRSIAQVGREGSEHEPVFLVEVKVRHAAGGAGQGPDQARRRERRGERARSNS